ncbi:MAG: hypothetical protein IT481_08795 [Gammaproteobacteria bacterium]|nr:hypothetical protein [Gammaproteobacteria bacterium]
MAAAAKALFGACLALRLHALPTRADEAAPQGIPAPAAWDYVRMTPEERSALRDRVDALPAALREAHNTALSANVNTLPTWLYEALSHELVARHHRGGGSYAGPLPRPPEPDAWGYVDRPNGCLPVRPRCKSSALVDIYRRRRLDQR